MSSSDVLGNVPGLSHLVLIDGQDFAYTFETATELPGGTLVVLEILNRDRSISLGTWAVTALTVRIDATDHADIPHGSWFRVWVTYPNDGGRLCALAGPVERNIR